MGSNIVVCKVCGMKIDKYHFQQHLKKHHMILFLYEYGEKYHVDFRHKDTPALPMCYVCNHPYAPSAYRMRAGDIGTQYIEIMTVTGCKCPKGVSKNVFLRDRMLFGHDNARVDMFKGRFTLDWYIERFGLEGRKLYNEKHKRSAGSLEAFIARHGEEEGTVRYKSFSAKCAYYNTLEGKIDRYGEEEGLLRYQHYTSTIKRNNCRGIQRYLDRGYSEVEAKEAARKYNSLGSNLEYFKKKYGIEEGTNRYDSMLHKKLQASKKGFCRYSKASQKCFIEIMQYFNIPKDKCYFGSNEKIIDTDKKGYYRLDFYNKYIPLWIEFNGDFWHANPKLYAPEFKISGAGTQRTLSVTEIWKKDSDRIQAIKEVLNIDPIIIWESDWYNNKDEIMHNIKNVINRSKI